MKVGVVLLNWNGGEFTIPCIQSLLASSCPPWRIVVVDNGSTDGSPDRVSACFPDVLVVRSPENIGFAAGNNAGIRRLLTDGAELIWVLNNDTEVAPDCLSVLVAEMKADPDLAAASGKILFATRPNQIWYAGADWRYWSLSAPHRGEMATDVGQFDTPTCVGFLSGCCMLVRRWAFERIGMFDEDYFAYYEDADWCLRARIAGLRLRYVPSAVLWHRVSATIRKNTLGSSGGTASPLSYFLSVRNRFLTIRRHATSPLQRVTAIALAVPGYVYVSCGLIVLRRWEKLRALWNGAAQGLRSDLGRKSKPLRSR
jgi:GT2 family glycosyltransferase